MLPLNKRHALIVRVGEKRILHAFGDKVDGLLKEASEQERAEIQESAGRNRVSAGNGKRKAVDDKDDRKKKRR